MQVKFLTAVVCVFAALGHLRLSADEVVMRSGQRYEGMIVAENDDELEIEVAPGEEQQIKVTLKKKDVRDIVRDPALSQLAGAERLFSEGQYAASRAALDSITIRDAKSRAALMALCLRARLLEKSRDFSAARDCWLDLGRRAADRRLIATAMARVRIIERYPGGAFTVTDETSGEKTEMGLEQDGAMLRAMHEEAEALRSEARKDWLTGNRYALDENFKGAVMCYERARALDDRAELTYPADPEQGRLDVTKDILAAKNGVYMELKKRGDELRRLVADTDASTREHYIWRVEQLIEHLRKEAKSLFDFKNEILSSPRRSAEDLGDIAEKEIWLRKELNEAQKIVREQRREESVVALKNEIRNLIRVAGGYRERNSGVVDSVAGMSGASATWAQAGKSLSALQKYVARLREDRLKMQTLIEKCMRNLSAHDSEINQLVDAESNLLKEIIRSKKAGMQLIQELQRRK